MNKRKILIIGPTEYQGGIESFTRRLIDELNSDFDFSVLQFRSENIVDYDYYVNILGIPVYKLLIPNGVSGKLKRKKIATLFFKTHSFDIIHINTNSPDSYFWAQAALKFGMKVIFHSHNGSAETIGGQNIPTFMMNYLRRIQRSRLLKLNTFNVQVSDIAGKWMFGKSYNPNNTVVNGIDVNNFKFDQSSREELRQRFGIKSNDKVVLIASRLVEQKNIFRAVKILDTGIKRGDLNYAFIIGEGNLGPQLVEQLKKLGENKIKYMGLQKNVKSWLSMADVLLMPSLYEGLPYSVIESQATGLPVVLSNTITKQVQLTDLITYLDLNDSDSIWSKSLKEMIIKCANKDRHLYNEKIDETKFSIKNFRKQFSELYKSVVNNF
jgi:glycosyltransferase involved in cell wall biosynthesis